VRPHQLWSYGRHPAECGTKPTNKPYPVVSGCKEYLFHRIYCPFTKNGPSKYTTTALRPFSRDHLGEPVPEKNFWTLCCKGRLTEADTVTIRLGATPSGLTNAHLHHPPYF